MITMVYHFLLGEVRKRLKPPTASTGFRCADWHPPKHSRFFMTYEGAHIPISHQALHLRKMPKVPKAGSKYLWLRCTVKGEKTEERRLFQRKSWSDMWRERRMEEELQQKCIGFLYVWSLHRVRAERPGYCRHYVQLLFQPFDTDSNGVTSALHSTTESNMGPSAFVLSCPLPYDAVRLK